MPLALVRIGALLAMGLGASCALAQGDTTDWLGAPVDEVLWACAGFAVICLAPLLPSVAIDMSVKGVDLAKRVIRKI